ncbi:MAG: hypothetical protein R2705_07140 [Ilumatobacteraceae bacterium]
MPVLFVTHEAYLDHLTGSHHPERPARLGAVLAGSREASVADGLIPMAPEPAPRETLELVHPAAHLDRLARVSAAGGGNLDADTVMSSESWDAAVLAAGAGLTAIAAMERGEADAVLCAVRPPGHHASPGQAMGFCLAVERRGRGGVPRGAGSGW